MKRLLMIAATVAVLGFGAAILGGAVTSAQEGDGPVGTLLEKVADKLGVSQDELETAFQDARIEMIDEAVAAGQLTEEEAERLRERVEEGNFLFPLGRPHPRHHVMEAAAEVLGVTTDELIAELQEGNSLADVAEAHGMDVEEFEAELLAELQADLDQKVADGTITQEEADRISEELAERIDRIVNAQPGEDGFGCRWRGPRPHGPAEGFGPLEAPEELQSSDVTA